jgi:hypothetical protein
MRDNADERREDEFADAVRFVPVHRAVEPGASGLTVWVARTTLSTQPVAQPPAQPGERRIPPARRRPANPSGRRRRPGRGAGSGPNGPLPAAGIAGNPTDAPEAEPRLRPGSLPGCRRSQETVLAQILWRRPSRLIWIMKVAVEVVVIAATSTATFSINVMRGRGHHKICARTQKTSFQGPAHDVFCDQNTIKVVWLRRRRPTRLDRPAGPAGWTGRLDRPAGPAGWTGRPVGSGRVSERRVGASGGGSSPPCRSRRSRRVEVAGDEHS